MPQADPKALMALYQELKEQLRRLQEENNQLLDALQETEEDWIAQELIDLLNQRPLPKQPGEWVSPELSVRRH